MSFANIVEALGAAANGYGQGTMQGQSLKMQEDEENYRQWQRQQAQEQAARDAETRSDVAAAAVPVSMQTSGGKPDTMDDSDVGQDGEAPVSPNTYSVAGKSYLDSGQAQKAVDAANSPTGQASRIAQAYLKSGNGSMAMQVQREAQQSELAQLGLDEKHRQVANELYDQQLGGLTSHDAIANFISNANGDGQGGALKVQAVPSDDGKSVTYNKVNDDGSMSPISGHTYANTPDGVQQAQLWLSKSTPLAQKITTLHQQATDALSASKTQAEIEHLKQEGVYLEKMGDAATMKADKVGQPKQGAYERMDEADKLQYQNTSKQAATLQDLISKGLADGSLKEGDVNKTAKDDPAFQQIAIYSSLIKRLNALQLQGSTILQQYQSGDSDGTPSTIKAATGQLNGNSGPNVIPVGMQAQRDQDAGSLMVRNEYGGDLGRAQAGLAQIRSEAARSTGDSKAILLGEAARLQAGINAMGQRGAVPAGQQPQQPQQGQQPGMQATPAAFVNRLADMNDPAKMAQGRALDAAYAQQQAQKRADVAAQAQAFAEAMRGASMQSMSHQ